MPIFLYTGLPGGGKTIRAIKDVMTDSVFKDRQVYYYGIRDCKVEGWEEIEDPKKWMELPDGAVIFIDECQDIFPNRSTGSKVPEHVSLLATHRHRGFDFILITQTPKNFDAYVRGLVGSHTHVKRPFGSNVQKIYKWESISETLGKADIKIALKSTKKLPTDVFNLYKSAEVHTIKFKFPAKQFGFLGLFLMVAIIGVYYIFHWTDLQKQKGIDTSMQSDTNILPSQNLHQSDSDILFKGENTSMAALNWEQKRKQFFDDNRPFIEDLEWTKPKYVALQKPLSYPKPTVCISKQTKKKKGKGFDTDCGCYTQQATRLTQITLSSCLFYVKNGYFDDSKPDSGSGDRYANRDNARSARGALAADQPQISGDYSSSQSLSPTGAQSPLTVPSMPLM